MQSAGRRDRGREVWYDKDRNTARNVRPVPDGFPQAKDCDMLRKEKTNGISLRAVYALIIIAALIISGLMFYSTFSLTASTNRLTEAGENQIALDKAAHELMEASDYLTERVQRFTVAGDRRFLDEYFTEAFVTMRREEAIEKMSGAPGSGPALEQLQKAMGESRELMDREYYAMRLVADAKGYTDLPAELTAVKLSGKDDALSPEEKMQHATEMVLDDEYYELKDRIRADMQESLDALEALTRSTEDSAAADVRRVLGFARAVIVVQILVLIFMVWLTVRLGINPVLNAVEQIRTDQPIREEGASEFRYLANAYNSLTVRLNEENELLKEVSRTDGLTGIRNRMALRSDYDSYAGHEVTVMLMDLDDFKIINDTCGHEEGDRILSETGKLLAGAFGKEHCYRFGGDEFLVIYPDADEAEFIEKLDGIMKRRPILRMAGTTAPAGYSVGYVHDEIGEDRDLRELFSEADQKMYQIKRAKSRISALADTRRKRPHYDEAGVRAAEYTGAEMKSLLDSVSGMYDLARVVDPIECRILEFSEDGTISRKERCYGIWKADQKCVNCTSALACRTGCHQEKAEAFNDQVYHIQSNPVRLKLPDGGAYDAVVELVHIEKESTENSAANDRAAENKNQRAARYHALHDALTKVLNAGAFVELSREAVVKNPMQSWVMVTSNIMDFRLVNTLFGAQKGNELIVRNAEVLERIAAAGNGLCGRLGGDQFAMFLPKGSFREETLADAANELREEFSSGFFTCCVHFGVYEVQDASIPVSVMCDRANTALRTIRDNPRETVARFDETMMRKSLFEQEIISGFETALTEGQFRMYLQPLVTGEGRVIGAEALARWQKADGTLIQPGDFIETLEHAGLIHRLDRYIWECAVKKLAEWTGTGREDLTISVNMSTKDFYSVDVYQILTELTERYGVPCGRLRVEITETALLEDPDSGNEVIAKLRQKGFVVEIDDFGKGFSSLGLLKDIQADVLKIDMSLLREIESKPRSRMILESIVRMADSLQMTVVAEGVETETQLQSLTAMGCRVFQGYYFSCPVTTEEFEQRFE